LFKNPARSADEASYANLLDGGAGMGGDSGGDERSVE
jgi:hypothetical protein